MKNFVGQAKRFGVGSAIFGALFAASGAQAAGTIEGKYVGNGRDAKLAHVVVLKHEPWEGEAAYTLVITEQDPAASEKPDSDALFDRLGDALTLAVTASGKIFSSQICHQQLKRKGFSSVGSIEVEGFKIEGGWLSARFTTGGPKEFFDDAWEVDLTVRAELPKG